MLEQVYCGSPITSVWDKLEPRFCNEPLGNKNTGELLFQAGPRLLSFQISVPEMTAITPN